MIRLVILDFDGVVLESVSVKTEAFRKLFADYPGHIGTIVQFHLENGGMSRYDKFRYIFREILHENLSTEMEENLSAQFSELVFNGVINAPFVPGADRFLEVYSSQYPMYIVSATPEDELRRIVRIRQIEPRFQGICGSPKKKEENIAAILSRTPVKKEEILFVGDSVNDWIAARKSGIQFIGRVKPGDPDPFTGTAGICSVIPDLKQLGQIIEGLP